MERYAVAEPRGDGQAIRLETIRLLPMTGVIALCAVMALTSYRLLRVAAEKEQEETEVKEAAL